MALEKLILMALRVEGGIVSQPYADSLVAEDSKTLRGAAFFVARERGVFKLRGRVGVRPSSYDSYFLSRR